MIIKYNFKWDIQRHIILRNYIIYAKIPIPKDRLAVFTNYLCVTKDQALQERDFTLSTLWFRYFQPIDVTIEDTVACYNAAQDYLSKLALKGLVYTTTKPSLVDYLIKNITFTFYSLLKIFHAFNFHQVTFRVGQYYNNIQKP